MMSPLLCGLVLLLFSSSVSPSAPNDFDMSCPPEGVNETTVVLLDTYNYVSLPWNAIDLDDDNETVSEN